MRISLIASIILFCASMVMAGPLPAGWDRHIRVVVAPSPKAAAILLDLTWDDYNNGYFDVDGDVSFYIDHEALITYYLVYYDAGSGESILWKTTGALYNMTQWTGYNGATGSGCAGTTFDHGEDYEGDMVLLQVSQIPDVMQ